MARKAEAEEKESETEVTAIDDNFHSLYVQIVDPETKGTAREEIIEGFFIGPRYATREFAVTDIDRLRPGIEVMNPGLFVRIFPVRV